MLVSQAEETHAREVSVSGITAFPLRCMRLSSQIHGADLPAVAISPVSRRLELSKFFF